MNKLRFLPPLLAGIFCTASLYAANAERVAFFDIFPSLIISVLIGGLFALIFWLNKWTEKSMPFVASCFTLAILLWNVITVPGAIALMVISLAIGIKLKTVKFEKILTVVFAIAVGVSAGETVVTSVAGGVSPETVAPVNTEAVRAPNIYFIVPDRMTSVAGMAELGIDTTEFVRELYQEGFYIKADQLSYDTYTADSKDDLDSTRTMRYFASVLNDNKEIDLHIRYKDCLNLIRNPALTRELHQQGYTFYNIASWFYETSNIYTADSNMVFQNQNLFDTIFTGEFNVAFWDRTIFNGLNFKKLLPNKAIVSSECLRTTWQAMQVVELAKTEEQKFVMAHILMPHEPFVWTADGKPQYDTKLSEKDLYIEQIQFACGYLLGLVRAIIQADPSAIIIIQSDEGMAFSRDRELSLSLSNTQWNGVFTAWRIPDSNPEDLPRLLHTEILQYVLWEILP